MPICSCFFFFFHSVALAAIVAVALAAANIDVVGVVAATYYVFGATAFLLMKACRILFMNA